MDNAVIIIPALNPDKKFITLVRQLIQFDFSNIIVVNDGSDTSTLPYFQEAETLGCKILTHEVNRGKGRALKTAFAYILAHYPKNVLGVCVDADGQHSIKDMVSCLALLQDNPNSLVLGCRQFDKRSIPLRSRFGNRVTRLVFRMLCGINVSDTQTGLRAMTPALMEQFLTTKGDRYEFEMNMLIETKEKGIPIKEVPIETIYIDDNKASHFNPLKDSFRIYKVFLKFVLSSVLSFLIDILLFSIIAAVSDKSMTPTKSIFLATAVARVVSSLVNYLLNKKSVFRLKGSKRITLLRYYILCAVQLCCSALFVNILFHLISINKTAIKLVVDAVLFLFSFQLQREWVFQRKTNSTKSE